MRARLTLLLVAAVGVAGCATSRTGDADDTSTSDSLSSDDLDESVSPCDDFYQFACGAWIRRTANATDQVSINQQWLQDRKAELLARWAAGNLPTNLPQAQLVVDYVASCKAAGVPNCDVTAFDRIFARALLHDFSADAVPVASAMTEELRTAFTARLQAAAWLDDDTRSRLLRKLALMKAWVGGPTSLEIYDGLFVDRTDFRGNAQRLQALPVATDATGSSIPDPIGDIKYCSPGNCFGIPLQWMRRPFFSLEDPSQSYGALGSRIAHEISHAFDPVLSRADEQGQLPPYDPASGARPDWWIPSTRSEYDRRLRCIVDQYSGMHPDLPLGVVENKLNESFCDLNGLVVAHDAFVARTDLWPAPPHGRYTAEQQLFIDFAQSYCAKLPFVEFDPHPEDKFRVNGTLANAPAFATAFMCPADSKMVRLDRCEIF